MLPHLITDLEVKARLQNVGFASNGKVEGCFRSPCVLVFEVICHGNMKVRLLEVALPTFSTCTCCTSSSKSVPDVA